MRILYLGILTLLNFVAPAQWWDWARNIEFGTANVSFKALAAAGNGDFYLSASESTLSAYLLKCDSDGAEIWRKKFSGNIQINEIARSQSAVYIGGTFSGLMQMGNMGYLSAGGSDIFLAKLDANGNVQWVKTMGGQQDDEGNSVCCDLSGNVYFCGTFNGQAQFDGQTLNAGQKAKLFVAKYDAGENMIFIKSAGTQDSARGFSIGQKIRIGKDDRLHILAQFNNIILDTLTLQDYIDYNAQLIATMDLNGNFLSIVEVARMTYNVEDFVFSNSGNMNITGWDGWTSGGYSRTKSFTIGNRQLFNVCEGGYCYGDWGKGNCLASDRHNCYMIGWLETSGNCTGSARYLLLTRYDSLGLKLMRDTLRGNIWDAKIINDNNGGFVVAGTLNSPLHIADDILSNTNPVFIARFKSNQANIITSSSPVAKKAEEFSIFPNPAGSMIYVEYPDNENSGTQIRIRNILGEAVYVSSENKIPEQINISAFAKGLYLVELEKGDQKTVRKLLIE